MKEKTKQEIIRPDISDFYKEVLEITNKLHKANSFNDLINTKREEHNVFIRSITYGPEYVVVFKQAITDYTNHEVDETYRISNETHLKYEPHYFTGNEELDTYLKSLRILDWTYDHSDDINVWRSGNENYNVAKTIAVDKGGVYLDAFNYHKQLNLK